jgi:very-short-patch-repair endonuclease
MPSDLESKFELGIRALEITLIPQFKIPGSRYVWDYCHEPTRTLIEIDGGQWLHRSKAHGYGSGMERDCKKQNQAELQGWHVLRFCTSLIESGAYMDTMQELITRLPEKRVKRRGKTTRNSI